MAQGVCASVLAGFCTLKSVLNEISSWTLNLKNVYKNAQCPETDLYKKSLPRLKTITLAFHWSEMASLSDWTSGQSKNLKKESKSLPNHLLHSNFDLQKDQNF